MNTIIVKSVNMVTGPIGGHGFRSGTWTATTTDGQQFEFFGSLPHCDGMNMARMVEKAQRAIDCNARDVKFTVA